MPSKAYSLSAEHRRIVELMNRVERVEKVTCEQAEFLQVQFRRIAQLQAEIDAMRAKTRQR